MTLDFFKIRGDSVAGRRSSFEQLVCRLARMEDGAGEFRRIDGAGGDGGVEALRVLPTGRKVGYQAKYHLDEINWRQIDESVRTALQQHPELERYVIAVPCDFTGKRAARDGSSTEGQWGNWDTHKSRWEEQADAQGSSVSFEAWTAFEIEGLLTRPEAAHLIPFFFQDALVFTGDWMQRQRLRTCADLGARYSPDDHVDTESLRTFDVIYRRANIRRDLHEIFAVAQTSNPRAAAALVPEIPITTEMLGEVESALEKFLALRHAIDDALPTPWPVEGWITTWYATTRKLIALMDAINGNTWQGEVSERVSQATRVYELTRPQVFGGRWSELLPIDGGRAALLVGRAGAGKSHAIARAVEAAASEGAPVIHLLGQHILDDDPRWSILNHLELRKWTVRAFLTALDLAAEMCGTRALLAIDALNEGRGLSVWRGNHLASLVREVSEHDRLVLVLSCREEYLDYVIPEGLLAQPGCYPDKEGRPPKDCAPLGKPVKVAVEGFRTEEERESALRIFMDAKGIARPTAPILDDEFFNPLFMSSVCRSMAKAGLKVFPRGMHGASQIMAFVLETKSKALGTAHDGTAAVYNALLRALNSLAKAMIDAHADHVPLYEANTLINAAFQTLPVVGDSWLTILEGSDILRQDVERSAEPITPLSAPTEVVRFVFERLQDQLRAQQLLASCPDIEAAFDPGGPFEILIHRSVNSDGEPVIAPVESWVGVFGALWSAVAETHHKEIWDLRSFSRGAQVAGDHDAFRRVVQVSLRERQAGAFTSYTRDLFNLLWENKDQERLELLLSLSCVPQHAWNADDVAARLFSRTNDERKEIWSQHFTGAHSDLVRRAQEIADWASNVDPKSVDEDVVRLACLTLTCISIAENDGLRERTTKGLANLLNSRPSRETQTFAPFAGDPDVAAALVAAKAVNARQSATP